MTTTTAQLLLDLAVAALQGAPGLNGAPVFSSRDWPTWEGNYPCLLCQIFADTKTSQGRNSIGFTTVSTIRVVCRAAAPGGDDDLGTSQAETEAWALARQVEIAIINAPAFAPLLQQYPSIRSEMRLKAEGDYSVCDVAVAIEMEYYLDATDFALVTGSEITEQTAATSAADYRNQTRLAPGIDISNTP